MLDPIEVTLSREEILRRLPLATPAFAARPAGALVAGLLERIDAERLIAPRAAFRCIGVRRGGQLGIDLEDGSAFEFARPAPQWSRAESAVVAVWSLGPGVSRAIAAAFERRKGLQALLLDEIASLLVFRLGEVLFERLRQRFAAQGLGMGRPFAPGDGVLALAAQARVLALAGAGRIDVGLGQGGVMSPLKTASAVVAVGRRVRRPRHAAACADCASRARCRLRADRSSGTGHDDRRGG